MPEMNDRTEKEMSSLPLLGVLKTKSALWEESVFVLNSSLSQHIHKNKLSITSSNFLKVSWIS